MRGFGRVTRIGLTLPDVTAGLGYDGSPRLEVDGCFMAALASHSSAEPNSLVVRASPEERDLLLEDAPQTYYLTDYYRKYPLVLVRLSAIDNEALREVLSISRKHTLPKVANATRSKAAGRK